MPDLSTGFLVRIDQGVLFWPSVEPFRFEVYLILDAWHLGLKDRAGSLYAEQGPFASRAEAEAALDEYLLQLFGSKLALVDWRMPPSP